MTTALIAIASISLALNIALMVMFIILVRKVIPVMDGIKRLFGFE